MNRLPGRAHLLCLFAASITFCAVAAPPDWWQTRGVTDPVATPNHKAAVNVGTVKNMAKKALAELTQRLPLAYRQSSANFIALKAHVDGFSTTGTDHFHAVNQGMLKNLAKKFHLVLIEIGYAEALPWSATTNDDSHKALANQGMLKNLFKFDVGKSIDGDAIPDWWEEKYGLSPTANNATTDFDLDGTQDSAEFNAWTDPSDYYSRPIPIQPVIERVSPQTQSGRKGTFSSAIEVLIRNGSSGPALANAPVTFSVVGGGAQLATQTTGSPTLSSELVLTTDAAGRVSNSQSSLFFKFLNSIPASANLSVVAGPSQAVNFTFLSDQIDFSPPAGDYKNPVLVQVSNQVANSVYRYTTNGSLPDENSTLFPTEGLMVEGKTSLRVRAFQNGNPGADASANYDIIGQIATGWAHTLALKEGVVWSWGMNDYGQLGNGTTSNSWYPYPIPGLSNVVAIAAGPEFSIAVKSNGTVWAWGRNQNGQLGDGSYSTRLSPVQIPGLSGIVEVVAGGRHCLALKSNGTLVAWGYNGYGQLGDGSTTQQPSPIQVSGISNVSAITAGWDHSVVALQDGSLRAWGYNGYGQLGNGTSNTSYLPINPVPSIVDAVQVVAGNYHTLVLMSDGSVWSSGIPSSGELGRTASSTSTLLPITSLSGVKRIAAGKHTSAAISSSDVLYLWGENQYGQAGIGGPTDVMSPQVVPGISAKTVSVSEHTIFRDLTGNLLGFGANGAGRIGDGTNVNQATPTNVLELKLALQVEEPQLSPECASFLQPGNVTVTCSTASAIIRYTTNGEEPTGSSPAIASGGSILITGDTMLRVKAFKSGILPSRTRSALYRGGPRISVGDGHTLALLSDGTVWAWGNNSEGQLGLGHTVNSWYPQKVQQLSGVIDISAGYHHSVALKSDGSVWTWGRNQSGELGDSTQVDRAEPMRVTGVNSIVRVLAGGSSS